MSRSKEVKSYDKQQLDKALAALIKNTRTTRRHESLPRIASWLEIAIHGLGSVGEVAERIGLSSKMLRQFLSVRELTPSVLDLFATRKLDSVDMAVHLRKLPPDEQACVAREAATGDLTTADVRAICEFRKHHGQSPIEDIVTRIKASRNIRQYVVEFVARQSGIDERRLRERFLAALGESNVVSLNVDGPIGTLVVNQSGRSRLQAIARQKRVSLAQAVNRIVTGDM
jgi:hypothetical protein